MKLLRYLALAVFVGTLAFGVAGCEQEPAQAPEQQEQAPMGQQPGQTEQQPMDQQQPLDQQPMDQQQGQQAE